MIKKDLDKSKVIKSLQKSDKDVGSSEVQIGILTERIKYLTEHFKKNKKDKHSNTGLSKLITLQFSFSNLALINRSSILKKSTSKN